MMITAMALAAVTKPVTQVIQSSSKSIGNTHFMPIGAKLGRTSQTKSLLSGFKNGILTSINRILKTFFRI